MRDQLRRFLNSVCWGASGLFWLFRMQQQPRTFIPISTWQRRFLFSFSFLSARGFTITFFPVLPKSNYWNATFWMPLVNTLSAHLKQVDADMMYNSFLVQWQNWIQPRWTWKFRLMSLLSFFTKFKKKSYLYYIAKEKKNLNIWWFLSQSF